MKSILATLGILGVLFSLIYAGQLKDYSKGQKPPKLIVSSPINSLITNHSKVFVNGRVENTSPVKVTVNGKQVSIHRHGQFSTLVSLQEGKNTITIIATDANNNSTTVTRVVTWDSSPPALTVIEPADGLITKNNSVRVSGTVLDETTVTVRVNGAFFSVDQTGSF